MIIVFNDLGIALSAAPIFNEWRSFLSPITANPNLQTFDYT